MLYDADSGLYLTQYRAYDPVVGRLLSRDPIGEVSDSAGNLYAYVGGDPISKLDPYGLSAQVLPSGGHNNNNTCGGGGEGPTMLAMDWKQFCFLVQCLLSLNSDGSWKPKMPPSTPPVVRILPPGLIKRPDKK